MKSQSIKEDDFRCGICCELIVDPTTLTCGHTMCRYCVALWWYNSKNFTCPECRQIWHGFPQINFTLRNTISTLFPEQYKEREQILSQMSEYKKMIDLFNANAKQSDTNTSSNAPGFNWTVACVIVAISIAIAVVVSFGVKKLNGQSPNDIMSRSIHNWSPEDVALWVFELGTWSKNYSSKFSEAGVDGDLLLKLKDEDLKAPPFNMIMRLHRRIFFEKLESINRTLSNRPTGLWEYKERRSGMSIFIMLGIREFPRATLAYLYIFNYRDTFLPIFYGTNYGIDSNLNKTSDKSIKYEDWVQFIPRFIFVPYYLVARFASHYLKINYWTSRVVIMHAILMTLAEFTKVKYFFTTSIRKLPYLGVKYMLYISLLSLVIKVIWPFVPFFIADCVFYWLLYVSPFDALNRLRKRLSARYQANQE